MQKFLQLNDLECYTRSFRLSNFIWNTILSWDNFSKNTVGIQFVRAMDSVSANIAEGFGRYGKKDKVKFYHYSYGSVKECLDWNEKSNSRNLVTKEQYKHIFEELQFLPKEINQLILYTNSKLKI